MASTISLLSNEPNTIYGAELPENHIRLIRLLPSPDFLDPIECILFEVSLDNAPAWQALSYTWGDESDQQPIHINGIKALVRKNLSDALIHLRQTTERVLWIDAICINQENIPERNQQVKFMKHIYKSASKVVIWLGPEADNSDLAMRFITDTGMDLIVDIGKVDGRMYHGLQAVAHLLGRPYWTRLWIIQEVVVARRIMIQCGRANATWKHLSRFKHIYFTGESNTWARELFWNDNRVDERYIIVKYLDEIRDFKPADCDLDTLLPLFQGAECSDVRDKIYGLLGIAKAADKVVIDYSKSPLDLFIEMIRRKYTGIQSTSRPMSFAWASLLQETLRGEIQTPGLDSPYAVEVDVVSNIYELGAFEYGGLVSAWDVGSPKSEFRKCLLQASGLKAAAESVFVLPISSSVAYGIKVCDLEPESPEIEARATQLPDVSARVLDISTRSTSPNLSAEHPESTMYTICRYNDPTSVLTELLILRGRPDHYTIVGRAMIFQDSDGTMKSAKSQIDLYLDFRTLQLITMPLKACYKLSFLL